MTWDELKEKAKEMGYLLYESKEHEWTNYIYSDSGISFTIGGTVMFNGSVVAFDRTPEQMLIIMRGLE